MKDVLAIVILFGVMAAVNGWLMWKDGGVQEMLIRHANRPQAKHRAVR